MSNMKLASAALGLMLGAPLFAFQAENAPQADGWDKIRSVAPGTNVRVTLLTGKKMSGKIQSWTPDGFAVVRGENEGVQVAKENVARVAVMAGSSRGRRALLAGAIAGGAAAGIMALKCRGGYCSDVGGNGLVAVSAALLGGGAAGIAAAIPTHYEVIYTAPSEVLSGATGR